MHSNPSFGQRILELISPAEWELIRERLGVTPRQMEVARAFFSEPGGGKPQTIARRLGIEPCSVKTHTERLYRNLGASK